MRYERKDALRTIVPAAFQNGQGRRQQFDDILRVRLATVACDPPVAVRILFELFPNKGFHIRVADTRKTGEEEQVADDALFLRAERSVLEREAVRTYEQRTTIRYQVSEISAFYPDCW